MDMAWNLAHDGGEVWSEGSGSYPGVHESPRGYMKGFFLWGGGGVYGPVNRIGNGRDKIPVSMTLRDIDDTMLARISKNMGTGECGVLSPAVSTFPGFSATHF